MTDKAPQKTEPFQLDGERFLKAITAFITHAPIARPIEHNATLENALIQALKAYGALSQPSAPGVGAEGWRCFHCGEVFTDSTAAEAHFGPSCVDTPVCQIPALAEMLRDLQREISIMRSDDLSQSAKEYHALGAQHYVRERDAEQSGYDKGLADGRAEAAPTTPPSGDERAAEREALWKANLRALWEELSAIREFVEDNAPPGSVTGEEYLGDPEPMTEAKAIIEGIAAWLARAKHTSGPHSPAPGLSEEERDLLEHIKQGLGEAHWNETWMAKVNKAREGKE
jgi:hypothetical protein